MTNRAARRREGRSVAKAQDGSRLPWVIGGVVVLGVAIVVWNLVSALLDETARVPVALEYSTPQELVALAIPNESGNPNATVQIVEFADYQCPSCRDFFLRAKPFLDMTYIQSGQVRFTLFDFPLVDAHPNAFLAARAARCAGDQDGYWAFHDRLFQTQSEWSPLADPSGAYAGYAEALGLDSAAFATCLASDRHAETVTANMLIGAELGVRSTPTVMVDTGEGREIRVDDTSVDYLRSILDAAVAAAAEPAGAGQ